MTTEVENQSKMSTEQAPITRRKVEWFAVYSDASGFSIPLRELEMRRLNIYSFYELGACLGALRLVGSLGSDLAGEVIIAAQRQLRKLVHGEDFPVIKILSLPASGIQVDIEEASKQMARTERIWGDEERLLLKSIDEFETILKAHLPTEHTYTIEQIRGFSMPILVDSAEQNFSTTTIIRIGEEVEKDIQQAGRCLAFELPTAAGIHMMRAFEKVFRQFYKACTGKDAGTTDIYKLIKDLRDHSTADPKILNILDQIRDLHRNPLAHEVFLEKDEAIELFDIAKSAITAMAKKL